MGPQPSRRLAAVLTGSVLVLAAGSATAAAAPVADTAYDVRLRDRLSQAPGPSGIVQRDPMRGGVRIVADRDGFLTGPSNAPPARVALDYVRRRPGVFRLDASDLASLDLTRRYTSESGVTHLIWQQTFRGIPLFDQGLRANVAADGRLVNVGGAPRPDLAVPSIEPRLTAAEALRALGRGRSRRATLVLFGDAARVRLAWRLLVHVDSQRVYDAVVDATNGRTLYRHNLVRHATGLVFENYPGAPAGGSQVSKVFPESGEDPWLTSSTRLFGNNAHVYSDEQDRIDGPPDPAPQSGDEIPPSAPGTWAYVHEARPPSSPGLGQDCPAVPGCSWSNFDTTFSWRVNREQAGTQLFYFVNRFHDHLRDAPGIRFDEASGNFEAADRVHAQVDDGASTDTAPFDDFPDCNHINNASVIPLPDGEPMLMQIYLWSSACQAGSQIHDVNAADDGMIVYHEYTHGMTNRLVTDAQGFSGLTGPQSGAMDEGFADWYALDFLNALGVEPDTGAPGELRAGKYLNDDEVRSQPFDCPVGASASVCPGGAETGPGGYTYGDFGKVLGTPQVHADGEIWAETLWDLRAALIAAHGGTDGIGRTRALVTDGLRLSPANPTFLDMRNAILQANASRGFGDRDRIWAVFAARGMGVRASTAGDFDTSPVEDFSVPQGPAAPGSAPSPPASDGTRPIVFDFSLANRSFRVGFRRTPIAVAQRRFPVGTRFRFGLSEPATVTITIARTLPGRRVGRRCRRPNPRLRERPRCRRYRKRGALTRRDLPAGRNRVAFSGRIGVRALRPGRYRATIVAVDAAGNESRKRRAAFRVVSR